MNNRQAVDKLLEMYQQYKVLNAQVQQSGRQLARAKLRGRPNAKRTVEYERLRDELGDVSDSVTFIGPTVWMMYKFEAYADEAQPIRTMHDFRLHCSKPGYICTKRFQFVNTSLSNRGHATLADTVRYPDAMLLCDAYEAAGLLEADSAFMTAWNDYEYYREGERVAKWENYAATE